jgi:hypothetical protein
MRRDVAAALALVAALVAPSVARAEPRPTLVARFRSPDAALGQRLTEITTAAARELGPVAATPAAHDDVLAISGCPTGELACLASAPAVLEVDRLVLGVVERDGDRTVVHLTQIAADGAGTERDVELPGSTDDAADAFAPAARAFLRGEPPPAAAVVDAPAPTSPLAPPEPSGAARRAGLRAVEPWTWAIAGGGLAVVGLGVGLSIAASNTQDEVDAAPTETAAQLDALASLERTGESQARWGGAALVVGTLATAAGAYLVIRQATAEAPAVRVTPVAGLGGAGVVVSFGGAP